MKTTMITLGICSLLVGGAAMARIVPAAYVTIGQGNTIAQNRQAQLTTLQLKGGRSIVPKLYQKVKIPFTNSYRESLHAAGIEAVDEVEVVARHKLTTATREGGLSPADIRVARTRAGWKQADLAQRLGVDGSLVSYWESGKKPVPEGREKAIRALLAPHLGPAKGKST